MCNLPEALAENEIKRSAQDCHIFAKEHIVVDITMGWAERSGS